MPRSRQNGDKRRQRDAKTKGSIIWVDDEVVSVSSEDAEEDTCYTADFSKLKLKKDHKIRPLWVCPSSVIYLEASSRYYRQAYDFLVAIAEPVSRPRFMHTYKLSAYSLYAAVSIGLTPDSIVSVLDRLSKAELPQETEDMIRSATKNFGKAKLVLKENRMYVESPSKETLQELLKVEQLRAARKTVSDGGDQFELTEGAMEGQENLDRLVGIEIIEEEQFDENEDESDARYLLAPGTDTKPSGGDAQAHQFVYSFEIHAEHVEAVRRAALRHEYPLMEEYEFRRDKVNANLAIDLKAKTEIRPYQERSLSKMFGNGRARSGIIVLPCGAGKTLTGITACCTIKKSCIVLCTGGVACAQWKQQLEQFTSVSSKNVYVFTAKEKNEIDKSKPCILITTYSMMAARSDKRSAHTAEILASISAREWGLMILDEVHVTPARLFRRVLTNVKAHCKLGLTATLVREDELIQDLNFLIGPKLYEANWLDLTEAGYLAKVLCREVWCPMTKEFFAEYLHESAAHVKQLLYTMNPMKCIVADHLVRQHEARGDKVLVFCDNIMAVKYFAELLNRPYISGETSFKERMVRYNQFRKSSVISTLVLSKVGDVAIDLPEANVIVQVSSHFGSRRQEAQRLGRILRPKNDGSSPSSGKHDSYFYTLVSTNTEEVRYASKRQQYLINQGYNYKVLNNLAQVARGTLEANPAGASSGVAALLSRTEQLRMLQRILVLSAKRDEQLALSKKAKAATGMSTGATGEMDEEQSEEEFEAIGGAFSSDSSDAEDQRPVAKRRRTNMDLMSGAGTLQYLEYSAETEKTG
eukprot:CAMPEP_0184512736 /NCGR_PEP_ID=MMETSP0198_2-20121128/3041_1 /TAXON_ID=1112570 /ORGANISM="Thraustochytrium sp., Strain LLF1b" /LENGTH=810 /DNA_ID=CAMNT_0026902783 /DNA_START=313 /DNA_END=2745 /DNA_ORIENTATION=-